MPQPLAPAAQRKSEATPPAEPSPMTEPSQQGSNVSHQPAKPRTIKRRLQPLRFGAVCYLATGDQHDAQ